jgi:hemerythrin
MTPEQTRLLAESFSKLENRLYDLGSLIFQKLFEISPESRSLFKGDMEEQKLKLTRVFAEFVRRRTRSHHFLPVTGKGGEVIIPGIGALGARHELNYGVRPKHYAYMREALLYAVSTLLGSEYNEETGRAWGETFDLLAGAMQKQAGQNAEAVAFARLFHQKGAPQAGLFVEWSDKLSVGFEQIDDEHKKLLDLINVLNGAMQGGAGQGLLGGVLEGLIQYASYHFTHEEGLFQRSNYPAFEMHRGRAFTARVKQMYADFQRDAASVQPVQVLEFLKNWLQHHIMESDRAFTAYLSANPAALKPE